MNCSEYIENYRKKKNISKADLARKMGIFPQAYNMKLKKDTWTVNQLKQIAGIFGARLVIQFLKDGEPLVRDFNGDISR